MPLPCNGYYGERVHVSKAGFKDVGGKLSELLRFTRELSRTDGPNHYRADLIRYNLEKGRHGMNYECLPRHIYFISMLNIFLIET